MAANGASVVFQGSKPLVDALDDQPMLSISRGMAEGSKPQGGDKAASNAATSAGIWCPKRLASVAILHVTSTHVRDAGEYVHMHWSS